MSEFKEKYFDEAFSPVYLQDGRASSSDIMYMTPEEFLVVYNRLRSAVWELVKNDYDLFVKLRDLKDV